MTETFDWARQTVSIPVSFPAIAKFHDALARAKGIRFAAATLEKMRAGQWIMSFLHKG